MPSKHDTSTQCRFNGHRRREEHDISMKILHQAGFETARQAAIMHNSCTFVVLKGDGYTLNGRA